MERGAFFIRLGRRRNGERAMSKGREKREEERQEVSLPAKVTSAGGEIPCQVLNISPGGAKIEAHEEFDKEAEIKLTFVGYGGIDGRVVWRQAGFHGLQFKGDRDKIVEILLAVATYRSK
jgi:hypothetical protein